jgi:hypothetical protein
MTTTEKFFEKLFLENERAVDNFKNYNYEALSNDERNFLNRLTLFSKYKSYMKSMLINPKKVKISYKKDYIDIYKQCLTYKELMEYNKADEEKEDVLYNSMYIFGGLMIVSIGFFMIKRPSGASLTKDYFYSFLFSGLAVYSFNKWHYFKYKSIVDDVYEGLSGRLNALPHLKTLQSNENIFSTDLMDEDDD